VLVGHRLLRPFPTGSFDTHERRRHETDLNPSHRAA
jgi:hypothetical protein